MSESNVNFDFQIENNKVRAENDKIKEKLNAEISNDENKKVNFSHEKNMTEQKNATLVQVNNLSNHNSNLAYNNVFFSYFVQNFLIKGCKLKTLPKIFVFLIFS